MSGTSAPGGVVGNDDERSDPRALEGCSQDPRCEPAARARVQTHREKQQPGHRIFAVIAQECGARPSEQSEDRARQRMIPSPCGAACDTSRCKLGFGF